MAKKIKVSRIAPESTPSVNIEAFATSSELPTAEQANKTVEVLTGQIEIEMQKLKIATKNPEPKTYGRPIKEAAKDRVKFTTSLRNDLVKWLKIEAAQSGRTAADVLEIAVLDYVNYKNKLKN